MDKKDFLTNYEWRIAHPKKIKEKVFADLEKAKAYADAIYNSDIEDMFRLGEYYSVSKYLVQVHRYHSGKEYSVQIEDKVCFPQGSTIVYKSESK